MDGTHALDSPHTSPLAPYPSGKYFNKANQRSWSLKNLATKERGRWPSAMRSFLERLRWHCHFIQKLEDEPTIEWQNFHPAYDTLRQEPHLPEHLKLGKKARLASQ